MLPLRFKAVMEPIAELTSRLHKVQKHMHTVIPEPRVSLNPRLFRENIIILPLKITADLAETRLIVDAIAKARRVYNSQADSRAFLIKLQLHSDRLDLDRWLASCLGAVIEVRRCVGVEVGEHALLAESVDEGGAACA